MYHPRLKGNHYDLNSLCHEICEGNPAKSAFRTETRLAWGDEQSKT